MKVFLENVGPVDKDEDEDGEEAERSRREYFFTYETADPTGIFGIECHDSVWNVGWLEQCVGDQEPDGSKEACDKDEAVECSDDVGFNTALFSTPGHSVM